MKNTKHLLIRIAEFSYIYKDAFLKADLIIAISPSEKEKDIINKYFENSFEASGGHNNDLETPFFVLKKDYALGLEGSVFAIKQDILFSYIDYLELQEARTASKNAMRWAIAAIIINIVAIAVQIYTSQSTEIDESQFVEIKNLISSEIKK